MALTENNADGKIHAGGVDVMPESMVPEVSRAPAPDTAVSGSTHKESGAGGPDPTGLRGTLQRNFAAAAKQAADETNSEKPEKVKAEVSRETPEKGPDGKFLPKKNVADVKEETETAEETKETAEEEPDAPPSTWRAEAKALWVEIDRKFAPEQAKILKEELRKRENDFKNGIIAKDTELRAIKPFHEEIQNIIKPELDQWKAQGVTPQQAIHHLVQLNQNFRQNPVQTILWLANAAKINIADLARQAGQPPAQQQQQNQEAAYTADPQFQPLLQEINGLKTQFQQFASSVSAQSQNSVAAEIQSVQDEKDASGNPVRPYFNEVFGDIQVLLPAIRAQHPGWSPRQVAIAAYDKAVWANDDTRQKLNAATETQKKANEAAAARQRAAEAAAKSVKGGPPNAINGEADPKDLRGVLKNHFNRVMGSGESRL